MKKITFFTLFIFTLVFSKAQTPQFQWAKSVGGNYIDNIISSAVDASGNIYSIGNFDAVSDLDPGAASYTLSAAGNFDIFIFKLDASGNFVWARQIGSTGDDRGYSITIDQLGDVYVTGDFQATVDFDPGATSFFLTSSGLQNAFILKLDPLGNFIWAKILPGTISSISSVRSITTDPSNNICMTGVFKGTIDFDPGSATFNMTSASTNYEDIFVLKLDPGSNFIWAKNMGGSQEEFPSSIAVDATGNILTTGYFAGTSDFDPGVGTFNLTAPISSADVFISKLNSNGNFIWAKQVGGSGTNVGNSVALDGSGNVYVTGYFTSTADFDPGSSVATLTVLGGQDAFLLKLDASGAFLWAQNMGAATKSAAGNSVVVDSNNDPHVVGFFQGIVDFDGSHLTYNLVGTGSYPNTFILKLDQSGNFTWAQLIGGVGHCVGNTINIDAFKNIYVTGVFSGTDDFDPSSGTYTLATQNYSLDGFILKLSTPVGVEENFLNNNFTVFPNPNKGSFQLKIEGQIENGELILLNSFGQKVYEQKILSGQNNIHAFDLSSGLYHYQVLENKRIFKAGKIVIE